MSQSADIEKIEKVLKDLFDRLHQRRADLLALWHPAANLFINGEARPLAFFGQIPPFVGFELVEIRQVDVHLGVAAAALLHISNSKSKRHHCSFIQAKQTYSPAIPTRTFMSGLSNSAGFSRLIGLQKPVSAGAAS